MDNQPFFPVEEAHMYFAKRTNGEVWKFLENEQRTEEDDAKMLSSAFASLYHWQHVGNNVNFQRANYMIALVYLALKKPGEALPFAKRCLALTEEHPKEMKDFDVAYAFEISARVKAAVGEMDLAMEFYDKAKNSGDLIENDQDREIFAGDFYRGEWYGLV